MRALLLAFVLLGMLLPRAAHANHAAHSHADPGGQYNAYVHCSTNAYELSHGACSGPYQDAPGQAYYYMNWDGVSGGGYSIHLFSLRVCTTEQGPPNADGTCGAQSCSERDDVIKIPTTNPPASVCSDGCTYAYDPAYGGEEGIGPICDQFTGQNCYLPFTTAGAASSHAAAPNDPRFDETCTSNSTPGSTANDSDADGIPNNQDPDNMDSDGDGVVDSEDHAPNDADDGNDTMGDESDNTSTGGGNCSTPPVSTGDGIATQIAYQTWATRCEVEKLNRTATTGQGVKVTGSVGVSVGSGTEPTSTFSEMTATIPGEGVGASDAFGVVETETGIGTGFNDDGFLADARVCPQLPVITMPQFFGGHVIDLNDRFELFCTLMEYAGMFIWLFAALASLKIYSRVFN